MSDVADSAPDESPRPDPFRQALLDDGQRFELILVRHGQQADRIVDDSPLSDLGRKQAATVGEFLASENITAIYSSHLLRAHHTGLAIAGHHETACVVDERLREIQIGRDVPAGKRMKDLVSEEELTERGRTFAATRRWDSFALSETGDELRARVGAAVDEIRARHGNPNSGGKVVIACHGGVINAILGRELDISMDFFFKTAHCSVHRIRVGDDRMVIESINDTRHLTGPLLTY